MAMTVVFSMCTAIEWDADLPPPLRLQRLPEATEKATALVEPFVLSWKEQEAAPEGPVEGVDAGLKAVVHEVDVGGA